jgi:hypothetical protein
MRQSNRYVLLFRPFGETPARRLVVYSSSISSLLSFGQINEQLQDRDKGESADHNPSNYFNHRFPLSVQKSGRLSRTVSRSLSRHNNSWALRRNRGLAGSGGLSWLKKKDRCENSGGNLGNADTSAVFQSSISSCYSGTAPTRTLIGG